MDFLTNILSLQENERQIVFDCDCIEDNINNHFKSISFPVRGHTWEPKDRENLRFKNHKITLYFLLKIGM